MNKKLNEALQNEINRFKAIDTYQKKLINEGNRFGFHQHLPEADEMPAEEPTEDPNMAAPAPEGDPNAQAPDAGMDPNADPNAAPADDASAPMEDPNAQAPDAGMDPNADPNAAPADDMGGDMTGGEMGAEGDTEGDTEVDVTELVNNSNEIKMKVSDMIGKVNQSAQQFSMLMNKVSAIEGGLQKMDVLVGKMQDLTRQVELMRPATEAERRQALAKDSYPFNVTMDDYEKGKGIKNQTDMEKDPKMSMMKTIMSDYNDSSVKDSFQAQQDNPFKTM